ncbi:MAG: hypothetical protein OT477_01580 [Chloroflexi bacterium]|nr:hypothetical protein [Chloroflexota bacterium]
MTPVILVEGIDGINIHHGPPTAAPPLTVTPLAYLPKDLQPAFDKSQCSDYCWRGMMLGDSEAEILEKLRNDPAVDNTIDFQGGDFLDIERYPEEDSQFWNTGINWIAKGSVLELDARQRWDGFVGLANDEANYFFIPTQLFRLQVMLDLLGEPELITWADNGADFMFFILRYPQKRIWLGVWVDGLPNEGATLTGDSLVTWVSFSSHQLIQTDYCAIGYMRWGGLGDVLRYFPPANKDILVTAETIPAWCNDN